MTVFLTSFKNRRYDTPAYSVARYEPMGFCLPELKSFAPTYNGNKIKAGDSPLEYYTRYCNVLTKKKRWKRVCRDIDTLRHVDSDISLCCWCNITQQWKKGYSTLMCHTIPLGYILSDFGFTVKFDKERTLFGIDFMGAIENAKG